MQITGYPNDNDQLSDNFWADEFRCKCCGELPYISVHLLKGLEKLREAVDEPIHLTNGYRCQKHNAEVGGVPSSQHTQGTAADIYTNYANPGELAHEALKIFDGVGLYGGFVHVDMRDDSESTGYYYWEGDY